VGREPGHVPSLRRSNRRCGLGAAPSNLEVGFGGLAAEAAGNRFYADGPNNRIVRFDTGGAWTVFAGSGTQGSTDGKETAATPNNPTDLAIDARGNIFFVDRSNALVRRAAPNGLVVTLAYLGRFESPDSTAIAVDSQDNVYVAGFSPSIRVGVDGSVTNIPDTTTDFITSMTADSSGNIYLGTRGLGAQIIKVLL
jgi:hypothetical protein